MLGDAKKKIQRLIDLAEQLYEKVNELTQRVEATTEAVEDTNARISELEAELSEQRELLEALAERQGVDVEALFEATTEKAPEETEADA